MLKALTSCLINVAGQLKCCHTWAMSPSTWDEYCVAQTRWRVTNDSCNWTLVDTCDCTLNWPVHCHTYLPDDPTMQMSLFDIVHMTTYCTCFSWYYSELQGLYQLMCLLHNSYILCTEACHHTLLTGDRRAIGDSLEDLQSKWKTCFLY